MKPDSINMYPFSIACKRSCLGADNCSFVFQVLEEYAKYGDAAIGKWFVRDSGQKNPNVRTVFKPLLNMFHGARGSKHWKQLIDAKFKTATSVSQLLEVMCKCSRNVLFIIIL